MKIDDKKTNSTLSFEDYKKLILEDYQVIFTSRQTSILGRREVLSGKGTFGIFGDGKELPQIVLNRFFQAGDIRSGYYRDQTIMMAQGHLDRKSFLRVSMLIQISKMNPCQLVDKWWGIFLILWWMKMGFGWIKPKLKIMFQMFLLQELKCLD